MGWWKSEDGACWGDGPADVIDEALDKVETLFLKSHCRKPTQEELRIGFEFSLRAYPND